MYDMNPYLQEIDRVIAKGPFSDTWESLHQYRTPQWYQDAKFGIFIHWGVYSVPAFVNEWYPHDMYVQGKRCYEHHVKTYGPHAEFGYKDFIPMFKAEKFDPEAWAELFAECGAKYVMPVAEHHDGFQMYKSDISHWNAAEMGPCRDVLGELQTSFEKRGMVFCASSHRIEHWWFLSHGKEFDSDVKEPLERGDLYWPSMQESHGLFSEPAPSEEFMQDWLVRTCELVDKYRPKVIFFDWWIEHQSVKPWLKKFAAYYYNRAAEWGEEVAINYKHEAYAFGTAVPDIERGQFAEAKPYFWQTDTSIARNSWGYTENNSFKPARVLLCDLVNIVSKNGALLLNVGPKADGTISDEDTAVLKEIGAWMKVNGEAIYDAKVWRFSGEGPTKIAEGKFADDVDPVFTAEDIRFTTKGDNIYAAVLAWPEDGQVVIRTLAATKEHKLPVFQGHVVAVTVLGCSEQITWSRENDGLHVSAPSVKTDKPVVIKVTVS